MQRFVRHQELPGGFCRRLRARLLRSVLHLPDHQTHRVPAATQHSSFISEWMCPRLFCSLCVCVGTSALSSFIIHVFFVPLGQTAADSRLPFVDLFFNIFGTESFHLKVDSAGLRTHHSHLNPPLKGASNPEGLHGGTNRAQSKRERQRTPWLYLSGVLRSRLQGDGARQVQRNLKRYEIFKTSETFMAQSRERGYCGLLLRRRFSLLFCIFCF